MVLAKILDKKIELTFDTGFTGRLKISDSNYNSKKVKQAVETYGTNSVGAFGAGKPLPGYIFRTDELALGNQTFQNELVMTGSTSLIGNEFFKDFIFIMDWKNSKIYMKRIKNNPPKLESFGFGYRFIDAKPVVAFVFKDNGSPVQIGDSILSINTIDLDHLDKESACNYMINRVEKDYKTIEIKVKRDGKILDFKLDKNEYLK